MTDSQVNRNRSRTAAIPYAVVGTIVSFLILYFSNYLERWGVIPKATIEIPNSITLLPTFMLGGACAFIIGASQFFLHLTYNAIALMIAAQESITAAICELEEEDERKKGCSKLMYIIHAILLYCSGENFVIKKGDKFKGRNRLYDSTLTFLMDWALVRDKANKDSQPVAGKIGQATSGLIRMTMARGALNIVYRFGVRPGVVLMPMLYFLQIFVLVTLSFRQVDAILFSVIVMGISSYGMGVLICVAKNNANCLKELAGDRSIDSADRVKRFDIKVEEQLRAKKACVDARKDSSAT